MAQNLLAKLEQIEARQANVTVSADGTGHGASGDRLRITGTA
jgi:hypothetical protein